MMHSWKSVVLSVAMLAELAGKTQADQIEDFTFSFQNDPNYGNVTGTVSGDLVLDVAPDGSATATSVTILSFPSGLSALGSPPIDVMSWNFPAYNDFTVTNGLVTAGQFYAINYPGTKYYPAAAFALDLYGTGNVASFVNSPTDFNDVANNGGLLAANIDPVPSPEPASITLLVSGFFAVGGIGLVRRRRGRAGPSTAC